MIRYGLAPVQETAGGVRPRPTGPGQSTIARHRDFEADRQRPLPVTTAGPRLGTVVHSETALQSKHVLRVSLGKFKC